MSLKCGNESWKKSFTLPLKQSGSKLLETYGSYSKLFSFTPHPVQYFSLSLQFILKFLYMQCDLFFCIQAGLEMGKLGRWGNSLAVSRGYEKIYDGNRGHASALSAQMCNWRWIFLLLLGWASGSKILVNHNHKSVFFVTFSWCNWFFSTFTIYFEFHHKKNYFLTSQNREFNLQRKKCRNSLEELKKSRVTLKSWTIISSLFFLRIF